jgi:hypothetical protein
MVAAIHEDLSKIQIGNSKGLSVYLNALLRNIFDQYGFTYRLPTLKPVVKTPQHSSPKPKPSSEISFVPFSF